MNKNTFYIIFLMIIIFLTACGERFNNQLNSPVPHINNLPKKILRYHIDTLSNAELLELTINFYKTNNRFGVYDSIISVSTPNTQFDFRMLYIDSLSSLNLSTYNLDFGSNNYNNTFSSNSNSINQFEENINFCNNIYPQNRYEFLFDNHQRIIKNHRIPYLSMCGSDEQNFVYRYSANEDTCFIDYSEGSNFNTDTLIYKTDSLHLSNLPALSMIYNRLNFFGSYYSNGFDFKGFVPLSTHHYKLIDYVIYDNSTIKYTYKFNLNEDVSEILVSARGIIAGVFPFYIQTKFVLEY